MDQAPVVLGLAPSLHVHASGALTYCSAGEEPMGWDDAVLALAA